MRAEMPGLARGLTSFGNVHGAFPPPSNGRSTLDWCTPASRSDAVECGDMSPLWMAGRATGQSTVTISNCRKLCLSSSWTWIKSGGMPHALQSGCAAGALRNQRLANSCNEPPQPSAMDFDQEPSSMFGSAPSISTAIYCGVRHRPLYPSIVLTIYQKRRRINAADNPGQKSPRHHAPQGI